MKNSTILRNLITTQNLEKRQDIFIEPRCQRDIEKV